MTNYVLAPGYAAVQFWNEDRTDLVEVRRVPGGDPTPVEDIPDAEAKRLLGLEAIVEADSAKAVDAEPDADAGEEPAGNASREAWAEYADSLGLTVDATAGREDIKQIVADSRR